MDTDHPRYRTVGRTQSLKTDKKPEARGRTHKGVVQTGRGKGVGQKGRQGTEEQSQAVVATPRLLGTHHGLRALGAGLILGRWGQRGTAPGCGSPGLGGSGGAGVAGLPSKL